MKVLVLTYGGDVLGVWTSAAALWDDFVRNDETEVLDEFHTNPDWEGGLKLHASEVNHAL